MCGTNANQAENKDNSMYSYGNFSKSPGKTMATFWARASQHEEDTRIGMDKKNKDKLDYIPA